MSYQTEPGGERTVHVFFKSFFLKLVSHKLDFCQLTVNHSVFTGSLIVSMQADTGGHALLVWLLRREEISFFFFFPVWILVEILHLTAEQYNSRHAGLTFVFFLSHIYYFLYTVDTGGLSSVWMYIFREVIFQRPLKAKMNLVSVFSRLA